MIDRCKVFDRENFTPIFCGFNAAFCTCLHCRFLYMFTLVKIDVLEYNYLVRIKNRITLYYCNLRRLKWIIKRFT